VGPSGNPTRPAKRSRQPEASLAQAGSNLRRRSVDSECAGRGIEPRKVTQSREPTLLALRKATPTRRNGLARTVPPGSKARACTQEGPPGTWESPSSPRRWPEGETGTRKPLACRAAVAARREWRRGQYTKMAAEAWYGQANERKRGRKGGGASEHPVVPWKSGNPRRGNPAEGRGCRIVELSEGNTAGACHRITVSTKCGQIADRPVRAVGRAKPASEEPDAGILQVRIRGEPGRATAQAYPTSVTFSETVARKVLELRLVARQPAWKGCLGPLARPRMAQPCFVSVIVDTEDRHNSFFVRNLT
jgi:hypothetical protein